MMLDFWETGDAQPEAVGCDAQESSDAHRRFMVLVFQRESSMLNRRGAVLGTPLIAQPCKSCDW